jgi:transcription elongation factor Elf1
LYFYFCRVRAVQLKGVFMTKKLMIQFTCPKCDRELAWAYEHATVYCRSCDRWVKASEIKRVNPAKIDPDKDQLTLFE